MSGNLLTDGDLRSLGALSPRYRYAGDAAWPQFRYVVESQKHPAGLWRFEWIGELRDAFRWASVLLRKRLAHAREHGLALPYHVRGRLLLIDDHGMELRGRTLSEGRRES